MLQDMLPKKHTNVYCVYMYVDVTICLCFYISVNMIKERLKEVIDISLPINHCNEYCKGDVSVYYYV